MRLYIYIWTFAILYEHVRLKVRIKDFFYTLHTKELPVSDDIQPCFHERWVFKLWRETECDELKNTEASYLIEENTWWIISQLMRCTGNKLVTWLGMKRASWRSSLLTTGRGSLLQNIGDSKAGAFRGCEDISVSNRQNNNRRPFVALFLVHRRQCIKNEHYFLTYVHHCMGSGTQKPVYANRDWITASTPAGWRGNHEPHPEMLLVSQSLSSEAKEKTVLWSDESKF